MDNWKQTYICLLFLSFFPSSSSTWWIRWGGIPLNFILPLGFSTTSLYTFYTFSTSSPVSNVWSQRFHQLDNPLSYLHVHVHLQLSTPLLYQLASCSHTPVYFFLIGQLSSLFSLLRFSSSYLFVGLVLKMVHGCDFWLMTACNEQHLFSQTRIRWWLYYLYSCVYCFLPCLPKYWLCILSVFMFPWSTRLRVPSAAVHACLATYTSYGRPPTGNQLSPQ